MYIFAFRLYNQMFSDSSWIIPNILTSFLNTKSAIIHQQNKIFRYKCPYLVSDDRYFNNYGNV